MGPLHPEMWRELVRAHISDLQAQAERRRIVGRARHARRRARAPAPAASPGEELTLAYEALLQASAAAQREPAEPIDAGSVSADRDRPRCEVA